MRTYRVGFAAACAATTQAPTPAPTNPGETHAPTAVPTAASVTNTFTSSSTGCRYATIDNWPLNSIDYGCQNTPMSVPAGWQLAASTADSRRAAYSNRWGTDGVVFADGSAWGTLNRGNSSVCCGGFLGMAGSQYYALNCSYRRVFIMNCAAPMPTGAPTPGWPTPSNAPTASNPTLPPS